MIAFLAIGLNFTPYGSFITDNGEKTQTGVFLKQIKYLTPYLWDIVLGMKHEGGLAFFSLHGRNIPEIGITQQVFSQSFKFLREDDRISHFE